MIGRPAHRAVLGLGPRVHRAVVRCVALTATTGLVAVGGAGLALNGSERPRDFDVEVPETSPLGRLMERHDCSTLGFADGSTPRSAIVRRAGGQLDVVSFDEAWRTYTSDGPGQLVAVCLRAKHRR